MNEPKNLFNDTRPFNNRRGEYACPGCRGLFEIRHTERYQHGPDDVKYCPVYQSELSPIL